MIANAQYAEAAANTAARLIASGDMNENPTCAEAAGVATRMQPEAAAVADSLAVMPASPERQAAIDWNNALLDLIIFARAQPTGDHIPTVA